MDGILLVDKKKGDSSFDTVKKVKNILECRKAGHAGTLDPFATGLLIILINQGTKLFHFIMAKEKLYHAVIHLGVGTDTFDCTGKVVEKEEVPYLEEKYIKEKLNDFIGQIEQTPPAYSAIKQNGIRAYKLARRGIKVNLKKRLVHIYDINLISWKPPNLTISVRCSSGTYIRALAVDIAKHLGTCGHLSELRRVASGIFHVKDAVSISDDTTKEFLEKRIIPLADALPDFETVLVDDYMARKLRNGALPRLDRPLKKGYIKFVKEKELVAIARINSRIKLERVFN